MKKRATITDIAKKLEVSSGTVHRALHGKPGVGDELRAHIIETARQMGYQTNWAASSLKRKPLQIAAAFPRPSGEDRFFYSAIWQGFRDSAARYSDFNLSLQELPLSAAHSSVEEELSAALAALGQPPDGLLLAGHGRLPEEGTAGRLAAGGIPVALVGDPASLDYFACVQPDYYLAGRLMAEQTLLFLPPKGDILLLAGDKDIPSHYLVAEGFTAFLQETAPHVPLTLLHGYREREGLGIRLAAVLRQSPPAACCAVTARATALLGTLLEEAGLTGTVKALGSDVFPESARLLQTGTYQCLVHKNHYGQAYQATSLLLEYLTRREAPPTPDQMVETTLVLRSNLPFYSKYYSYKPTD